MTATHAVPLDSDPDLGSIPAPARSPTTPHRKRANAAIFPVFPRAYQATATRPVRAPGQSDSFALSPYLNRFMQRFYPLAPQLAKSHQVLPAQRAASRRAGAGMDGSTNLLALMKKEHQT
jgi:hypothetical protein